MHHIITNKDDLFSICVFIRAGAVFESGMQAGISHFLEHLLFRTKSNMRSSHVIQELSDLGGTYNGVTSKDMTYYYITTRAENYLQAMRLIQTIVFDLNISEKDFQHERKVCIEEMYEGNGYSFSPIQALMENALDGSIYGKSVIGSKDTLHLITLQDVKEFHNKHYRGCHVVASCPTNLKNKVDQQLGKLFNKNACSSPFLPMNYINNWNGTPLLFAKTSSNSCNILFKGYPYDTKLFITIDFIIFILSSGLNSYLNKHLREVGKSVYGVRMFQLPFAGTSLMFLSFATSDDIRRVYGNLLDSLNKFKRRFISKERFKEFKENFLLRQKLAADQETQKLVSIGIDFYYTGEPKQFETFTQLIKGLKYEEVKDAASIILSQPTMHLFTCEGKITSKFQSSVSEILRKKGTVTSIS